ncbi:MAG: CoA-transferase subunit beta [Pseudonocardia sp.]|nr:CoA-transferase subunit beta [Pseudonocardia sp.]
MTTLDRPPTSSGPWTADEMVTVAAARTLRSGQACIAADGLPARAADLARRLHAPDLLRIDGSGRIGDLGTVGAPELHAYWIQSGRIDVGLLSGAQIDVFGNLNTTVLGDYAEPDVRLPGAGSAPEIAASCREIVVVMRHRLRAFVERVDFVTALGFGTGQLDRALLGMRGGGPRRVITDLGVLEPDPATSELALTAVHPGVGVEQVRAETGWTLEVSDDLLVTDPPTPHELATLRSLVTGSPEWQGR